jgi:hypothetical protein
MATYNCLSGQDYRYQASKVANEIESFIKRWEHWAEQLNTIPADDLTALGLTEGEQTQMGSMRTDVVALVAWYRANAQTFVKRHAQMHIV